MRLGLSQGSTGGLGGGLGPGLGVLMGSDRARAGMGSADGPERIIERG